MIRIISVIFTLLVTLQTSAQILVIPDVHGRSFWKNAVAQNTDIPIIFLGDYLDPYAHENISHCPVSTPVGTSWLTSACQLPRWTTMTCHQHLLYSSIST